ncbi:hypothetical protein LOC68_18685 [Blastopirellula sp. JC732]|uniref:Uncharacterized protein n=1 Tax=Blastopirellula sediminis TaxID=2894196 RepID=A0A9X1MPB0_9BACT|nr:hypothetical protein [Blastopirellula sediminis]MCC9606276.1 hypothetical protein [Blastopirellula sediminis]MCC9630426.1 hypothetical protein [Blastopirellula sediminis]
MPRSDRRRSLCTLAVLVLAIPFVLVASPVRAQFGCGCGFGFSPLLQDDDTIIDVSADEFAGLLTSDDVWVDAELIEVEFLGRVRTEIPLCFGSRVIYPNVYRLHLKLNRPLFGRGKAPETVVLDDVAIGEEFYDNRFRQPPQVGDRVFANLTQDDEGNWRHLFVGIPLPNEIERVDRVKGLYELANSWRATDLFYAGFDDPDPYYAVWCMNALSPSLFRGSDADEQAYGRFRSKSTPERYREALMQLLETPETIPAAYVYATDELDDLDLADAEVERCHQAHCARLRKFSPLPPDSSPVLRGDELTEMLSSFYEDESTPRRRDILKILVELADSSVVERRTPALRYASWLHSGEDKALNAEILQLYRDHVPLREQNEDLLTGYWDGLGTFMNSELHDKRSICDAGIDLIEQKLPSAAPHELESMIELLTRCCYSCQEHEVLWRHLTTRLRTLYSLSAGDAQRTALEELLREFKIPLPADTRT